jgi:hypothetical protein
MTLVSINGIYQVPGVDYRLGKDMISFTQPPPAAATITIMNDRGVLMNVMADGVTYLFRYIDEASSKVSEMLEQAFKHRDVPAVADILERLQVVVELVKENDTIR